MKGALVVPSEFAEHSRAHGWEISGLLNWGPAMDWDILQINEDLGGYDVYLTNVSSTETEYIPVIRMAAPDAKIVACFDYGFDIVGDYFLTLERVKRVLSWADRLFSVNRNQLDWLRTILPDRKIAHCPHPVDVEHASAYRRPPEGRDLGVAAMWHQYDNQHVQSLEVLRAVEREIGRPIHKVLVGLKGRHMAERGMRVPTSAVAMTDDGKGGQRPLDPDSGRYTVEAPPGAGWDGVLPYVGVQPWYDSLSRFRAALDLYTVNSIGRFGMDCAAVGVPLAASNMSDSSDVLWPQTRVNPFEPRGAVRVLSRLLTDREFYGQVERIAVGKVAFYNFERSRQRMEEVLR